MHQSRLIFYKPSYFRAACAPTKLDEFLDCGIPCLANTEAVFSLEAGTEAYWRLYRGIPEGEAAACTV